MLNNVNYIIVFLFFCFIFFGGDNVFVQRVRPVFSNLSDFTGGCLKQVSRAFSSIKNSSDKKNIINLKHIKRISSVAQLQALDSFGEFLTVQLNTPYSPQLAHTISGQLVSDPFILDKYLKPRLKNMKGHSVDREIFGVIMERFVGDDQATRNILSDRSLIDHFKRLDAISNRQGKTFFKFEKYFTFLDFAHKHQVIDFHSCDKLSAPEIIGLISTSMDFSIATRFPYDFDLFDDVVMQIVSDIFDCPNVYDLHILSNNEEVEAYNLTYKLAEQGRQCLYENMDSICFLFALNKTNVSKDVWNTCVNFYLNSIFMDMDINEFQTVIDQYVKKQDTLAIIKLFVSGDHSKYVENKSIQMLTHMDD